MKGEETEEEGVDICVYRKASSCMGLKFAFLSPTRGETSSKKNKPNENVRRSLLGHSMIAEFLKKKNRKYNSA